ncbi:MAG: hypothetical protein K1X88_17605 [Nannocystaceae bacterium]|nr:hypothetical protein [Nannocystaceae bacterium]
MKRTTLVVLSGWVAACGGDDAGQSSSFGSGSASATADTTAAADESSTAVAGSSSSTAAGSSSGGDGPKLDVGAADSGTTEPAMGCTFVDLLFVVDNSLSMSEYQAALAAAFPGFVDAMYAELPPATDLHVGITTTDFYCQPGGCSCSEAVFNCATTASDQQVMDHYITPDVQDLGSNGGQGRLFEWQGMSYFATTTDADPGPLKQWFTGAATAAGEDGCSFEMSSAGAAWAADPANAATNAGFIRDEGAVLMVFVLSDEPDKSPETVAAYHDRLAAAKTLCGGDECILTAGLLDGCVEASNQTVWQFLNAFGEAPTWGDIDDTQNYTTVVGNALAQIVGETCDQIPPAG